MCFISTIKTEFKRCIYFSTSKVTHLLLISKLSLLKNKTERQIPSLFRNITTNTLVKHFVTFLHKIFIIYLLHCDYFINLQYKRINKLLFKRELIEK